MRWAVPAGVMRDKDHILPERLKPGLKLVFCGTAAGLTANALLLQL